MIISVLNEKSTTLRTNVRDFARKLENLIIEDLGDIGEETIKLREHYGFTRQKILQFSLDIDTLTDFDNKDKNTYNYYLSPSFPFFLSLLLFFLSSVEASDSL